MFDKKIFLIFIIVVIFVINCDNAYKNNNSNNRVFKYDMIIDVQNIETDIHSNYYNETPSLYLAKTIEEFNEIVNRYFNSNIEKDSNINIDFTEKNAIIVFQGQKMTGGYSIGISRMGIINKNNSLYVECIMEIPDENSITTMEITSPYVIISCDKKTFVEGISHIILYDKIKGIEITSIDI